MSIEAKENKVFMCVIVSNSKAIALGICDFSFFVLT